MDLVVDANIVFSFIIASSPQAYGILLSDSVKLYAPEHLITEIEKHKTEILKKSKLSLTEFDCALALIYSRISLLPYSEFSTRITKAREVCPDPNDVEYFAVALKINAPIWSSKLALAKAIPTTASSGALRLCK